MKIYRHKVKDGGIITFIWKDDKFYIITVFGTIITNTIHYTSGLYIFRDMFNSNKNFEIYIQGKYYDYTSRISYSWNQLLSDDFGIRWWIDEETLTEFHKMFDEYFYGP